MIRTQIPISVWESEGETVINTAFRLIYEDDHRDDDHPKDDLDDGLPIGGQSMAEWRALGLIP